MGLGIFSFVGPLTKYEFRFLLCSFPVLLSPVVHRGEGSVLFEGRVDLRDFWFLLCFSNSYQSSHSNFPGIRQECHTIGSIHSSSVLSLKWLFKCHCFVNAVVMMLLGTLPLVIVQKEINRLPSHLMPFPFSESRGK